MQLFTPAIDGLLAGMTGLFVAFAVYQAVELAKAISRPRGR
jgi:hypothetical protein